MTTTIDPTIDPATRLASEPAVGIAIGSGDARPARRSPTDRLVAIAAAVGPVVLAGSSLAWLAGVEQGAGGVARGVAAAAARIVSGLA